VSGEANRDKAEALLNAIVDEQWDVVRRLSHPDLMVEWPATGEVVRGVENAITIHAAYPGGLPTMDTHRVTGVEDQWVLDATFAPRRIEGSGDTWVAETTLTYPDGSTWEHVAIVRFRDGRVSHLTEYYERWWDAPEWRAQWVEHTR
jgi:hypothetical protein